MINHPITKILWSLPYTLQGPTVTQTPFQAHSLMLCKFRKNSYLSSLSYKGPTKLYKLQGAQNLDMPLFIFIPIIHFTEAQQG